MGVNTSTSSNALIDSGALFSTSGIQVGDIVKNIDSGDSANVTNVTETNLTLDSDIFTSTSTAYAVSATINAKLLSINVRWELPGLSFCNYTISVIQVA